MCGFAGVFSPSRSGPVIDVPMLRSMSDTIVHRGPDDEGQFVSSCGRVGFGFRRLSIIDLSAAGHQPMSSADGRIHIVFNGEIYNHLALRAELERAGCTYRSRTDTETILHAYRHWGERCIERFEGMFAIALWDADAERLLLYRDRIGIKPLYHTTVAGTVVFGSEIKALLAHPLVHAEVDGVALSHYLTFIHTPAPMTMYRGISKLQAGHYLSIDRTGAVTDTEYWDPVTAPAPDVDVTDERAVTGRIIELFDAAVRKRMMSDVPFGVFLSGGIDSSANVAFMAKMMDRAVDTFTVAIRGQEDTNEFQWARRMSALFRTNHHEVVIDDGGFLDLLPTIVHHQDEPLADPVCFPLYHVSKLARDNGTIVIQVGEGSDEQFAGYAAYLRARRLTDDFRWVRALPAWVRRSAYAGIAVAMEMRGVDARQNVIRNLFENEPVFWSNALAFYTKEKRLLLSDEALRAAGAAESHALAEAGMRRWREARGADTLGEMIYWELRNRLAELLLMRVDKVTMATSIEARVPFLDHALVEFTSHIPSSMKIRNNVPKYILKQALRGILPDEIIDRRKIGFAGSGRNMLTPEIFAHAKRLLLSPRHGYFNEGYVRSLLARYERTRVNVTMQIWALYNFELWHRYWIEGDRSLAA
jgi:asparagine synthase (glutamine-hydrolysing)